MMRKLLILILVPFIILSGCSSSTNDFKTNITSPIVTPTIDPVEQIKADLISQRITISYGPFFYQRWTFAALSEFEQFYINSVNKAGNIIEYDVSIRLRDVQTDTHYLMDGLITYTNVNGKITINVIAKRFVQI